MVCPEQLDEFRACKKQWFSWVKWSKCVPGLFKLEFKGTHRIAPYSKCYFMEDENGKVNLSSKGISKRQNKLHWERYIHTLVEGTERNVNELRGGKHLWAKKAGAECALWQTLGARRQDPHGAAWISHHGREMGGRAVRDATRRRAALCQQARQEVLREQSISSFRWSCPPYRPHIIWKISPPLCPRSVSPVHLKVGC